MSKTITFNIKMLVDGKEQLVTGTANLKDFKEAARKSQRELQRLNDVLINYNQKMEAMKNSIGAAMSKMNEWSGSVRRAQAELAKTAQFTGLQGDELNKYSASVKAVADAFGSDFNEVSLSANNLMKAFGISAEESLKLVKDGFVAGANSNGEYLDTLREYPRYFKEAGISAEEFIAITANAAKQGIYSDKGVDTIKEGNLRIREMTKATADALDGIGISSEEVQRKLQDGSLTTFQVMQMVGAKLAELPASSAKVGAAIADIFGGPGEDAGLEYIKSLGTIELSMDKVCEGSDEYSKALGKQADMQAKTNTLIVDFQAAVASADAATGGMLTMANSAVQALGSLGMGVVGVTQSAALLQKAIIGNKLVMSAWATTSKLCSVAMIALKTSSHGAAVGAIALKVALRGLMICTGIGAVVAALTFGVEALMDALDDTEDAGKDAAKGLDASAVAAKRAQDAFESTSSQTFGNLMSRYSKLQAAWRALSDEHQKRAWIANNRTELEQLGLTINSTADAENAFVGNTDSVVESFKKKAKAAALMAQLTEEYNTQMRLADKIATANEQANARHKVKAGDEVKGSSHTTEGGYEELGSDGKWRYTEKGAARNNSQTWYANGNQTKAWRKALADSQSRSGRLEAQIDSTPTATTTTKPTTPSKTTHTSGTPKPTKEVATPIDMEKLKFTPETGGAGETPDTKQTESDLKNLISYYEKQRSTLATTSEEYAEWTDKINAVQGSLNDLQGIKPDTEGIEEMTESLDDMKTEAEDAFDVISRGWGDIKGIGSSISSISDALEGNADAWTTITSVVDGALQMYQSISGIVEIIKTLTAATQGQAVAEGVKTGVTATSTQTTAQDTITTIANTQAAAANTAVKSGESIVNATASGASLPFPANIVAIAAGVAAVVAALSMVGSFSTGGIVGGSSPSGDKLMARVNSGEMILNRRQQQRLLDILSGRAMLTPTAQRVIESGGAATEVNFDPSAIARSIQPLNPTAGGKVEFRIRGKNLVGAMANQTRVSSASGKRTNIKI